ncbi:MAG TPA: hypothetical protein PK843_01345 [bacterium]|nr:hypothetical protein [bacterium]HPN33132.1 hypothetical protein [bacterium]
MKKLLWILWLPAAVWAQANDLFTLSQSRQRDLRLSVYVTADDIVHYLSDEAGRREALSVLRGHGMSKVFLEFHRGGLVVDASLLKTNRTFFENNGIRAVGGIATVPGKNFGVHQEAQLGWFNWQNPKTQMDVADVMRMAASVFDEIIIDDFFCTGDTSAESRTAKGDRSWSEYRRELLSDLATRVMLEPARQVRPDIRIIIKYPQWYDRFHLFGYDIAKKSALFSSVWVGTETRGANTQRYGFVQPFEGFVNYRWINSVSGKNQGAWFDHGDCDAIDFIDQAYMSVLAGAKELTVFSYGVFMQGHGGHHQLRRDWERLADLSAALDASSEMAVYGYKPANHDAGSDLYIFDYIGMLGIPFAPVSQWPVDQAVVFLPTQAAGDPAVYRKIQNALKQGRRIIVTAGFLRQCKNPALTELAGVRLGSQGPIESQRVLWNGQSAELTLPLKLAGPLTCTKSQVLVQADHVGASIPLLTERRFKQGQLFVLNTHTFSQADFDLVGEVLLAPSRLGLLALPQPVVQILRDTFVQPLTIELQAPARVTCQSMGRNQWFIQNFNDVPVDVSFAAPVVSKQGAKEGWSGRPLADADGRVRTTLGARERLWIR